MEKGDRSLTNSEKKALEIVLKLMKIGAIPSSPWKVWHMGPVGPLMAGPVERMTGRDKERRVSIENDDYSVAIRLRTYTAEEKDWYPVDLSVDNKLKKQKLSIGSFPANIEFILSLAD